MDAKQLKPYTFWIVCGAVVVIELGFILFWGITDEGGHSPEEVKSTLDSDYKKLEDLHRRAGNSPTGVMDAERPEHIKSLTEDFLITPKWKGVLQPHVDKYNQQLDAIKKDLSTRSSILHEAVADSGDLYAWYNAYVGKTKEVMLALRNAKALIVDDTNKEDTDFENGAKIRTQAGFFTKGEMTPPATEHPGLTARFRIMQKLSEALIASGSNSLPNPAVKTDRESDLEAKRPAYITGVDWKRSQDPSKILNATYAEFADAYELTLSLEGTTSALITAEAAIEGINSPVMIVAGGNLAARGNQGAGLRKGVADEPMSLKLSIAVIDFARIQTVAVAEPEPATKGNAKGTPAKGTAKGTK